MYFCVENEESIQMACHRCLHASIVVFDIDAVALSSPYTELGGRIGC
jgi:hypothetical protein